MSEGSAPKPDRVRITVVAAAAHPDVLSVQDAMRQVLDFFDLLTPEADNNLIWNLKLATTNSPLTVEGEPHSLNPTIDIRALAYEQKMVVEESFKALSEGRKPSRRLSTTRRATIKRVFQRNMNGIGKTEAVLTALDRTLFVTPALAAVGVKTLDQDEVSDFKSLFVRDRTRTEMGSIEGIIIKGETDYNYPSVLLRVRNTGQEVSCRLVGDLAERVNAETRLNDIWTHRRATVKGRISYEADGTIRRVWAHDLLLASPRAVDTSELIDPGFTAGLSVRDYLERLREGDLG